MDENENMDFFKEISDEEKEHILEAAEKCGRDHEKPEFIGIDDTFDFQCQQCGGCCMHRGDILLTGWDVFKAAKYLGITCTEFLHKYTTRDIGNFSKMPMVLLKSEDNGFCPFLKFDYLDGGLFKCTINPAKPGACASHPIGMVSSMNTEETDVDGMPEMKTSFIKVSQCPQSKGHNELHVVRDWMKHFLDNREESLKAHELSIMSAQLINWQGLFLMTAGFSAALGPKSLITPVEDKEKDLLLHTYSVVCSIIIEFAYAHYDTDRDFLEQVEENREMIMERFSTLGTELYDKLEELFNDLSEKTLVELLKEGEGTDYHKQVIWLSKHPLRYNGCTLDQAREIAENATGRDFDEEEGDEE